MASKDRKRTAKKAKKTVAKKAARKPAKAKARKAAHANARHTQNVSAVRTIRAPAARAPAAVHAPISGPAEIAVERHAHVLDKEAGADIGIVHGEEGPKVIGSVKRCPSCGSGGHHIRRREGRVRLQQLRPGHRGERHGYRARVEGVRLPSRGMQGQGPALRSST